jgi:hypothetical protein
MKEFIPNFLKALLSRKQHDLTLSDCKEILKCIDMIQEFIIHHLGKDSVSFYSLLCVSLPYLRFEKVLSISLEMLLDSQQPIYQKIYSLEAVIAY